MTRPKCNCLLHKTQKLKTGEIEWASLCIKYIIYISKTLIDYYSNCILLEKPKLRWCDGDLLLIDNTHSIKNNWNPQIN